MIFMCAQPDDRYFRWQIEIMIENFRKFGYSDKMHVLLYKPADRAEWNPEFEVLEKRYPEVKFFRYEDKGAMIQVYIPILRPHILKQHFQKYPELEKEAIFYHDADVLFTRELNLEQLEQGDTWYMSNTDHYIGYSNYFATKIKDVLPHKVVGYDIDRILRPIVNHTGATLQQFKDQDNNAGGAQYVLKNIDSKFWDEVEKEAINIKLYLQTQNRMFFASEDKGFQSWCADMWAILWIGLGRKADIKVTPELDFSWADSKLEEWAKKPIYHNTGDFNSYPHIFNKTRFHDNRTTPFEMEFTGIAKDYASYMYVQAIEEIKQKYYIKEEVT